MGRESFFLCYFSAIVLVSLYNLSCIKASEQDDLAPSPLIRRQIGREVNSSELETKLHLAYVRSLHELYARALRDKDLWKGAGNMAEILAWYDLLPTSLQKIVDEFCGFTHPGSVDYDHVGWNQWTHKRFGFSIRKLPHGHCYTLRQQLFLVALFNEYNRGECDLPLSVNIADKDVFDIYNTFRNRDKKLMQRIQSNITLKIHLCNHSFCKDRVKPIIKWRLHEDPAYDFSYPRVLHINDKGNLLLLHSGNLYRQCLLVRSMGGYQYHLDYIRPNEECYGALWINNEDYIVSIKKACIAKEDEKQVAWEERDIKKNAPQDLDVKPKKVPKNKQKKKGKRNIEYSPSASSVSASEESFPYCSIQCTVWSWPDCVKRHDACIINKFNADKYTQFINDQDPFLHNYMYAHYNDEAQEIVFIAPPYKHRWHYSFSTKKLTDFAIPDLCEGVVFSNGLKRAICPKGPIIKYGETNELFSFSWRSRFRWKKYHASKRFRAYNIADDGGMIGITNDGCLLELPAGRSLGCKPIEVGVIRDDWPVIFSPNNACAMLPVFHNPRWDAFKEAPVRWVFWKFPKKILSTASSDSRGSLVPSSCSSSSSASSSSSSSSSASSHHLLPDDCCLTM